MSALDEEVKPHRAKPWRTLWPLPVSLLWGCEFTEEFRDDGFDVRMLTGRKFYGLVWGNVLIGWAAPHPAR